MRFVLRFTEYDPKIDFPYDEFLLFECYKCKKYIVTGQYLIELTDREQARSRLPVSKLRVTCIPHKTSGSKSI